MRNGTCGTFTSGIGVTMDTLKEEADIDVLEKIQDIAHLELFTLVKSKQLVASLLFEEMDDSIEWASPLKAEVCFGPQFQEPKIDPKGPKTRLLRSGMKEGGITINPFYPLPYNIKNAISADLAIPDYRGKPMEKANLFAVIEIKFPGDGIRNSDQFDRYDDLSKVCAAKKTDQTTLARTNGKTVVGKGCRVALFRYPEDVKVTARDETQKDPSKPDQTQQKPTHKKRGK
jgi:hypothetical protein